jgi:hypothetical protein
VSEKVRTRALCAALAAAAVLAVACVWLGWRALRETEEPEERSDQPMVPQGLPIMELVKVDKPSEPPPRDPRSVEFEINYKIEGPAELAGGTEYALGMKCHATDEGEDLKWSEGTQVGGPFPWRFARKRHSLPGRYRAGIEIEEGYRGEPREFLLLSDGTVEPTVLEFRLEPVRGTVPCNLVIRLDLPEGAPDEARKEKYGIYWKCHRVGGSPRGYFESGGQFESTPQVFRHRVRLSPGEHLLVLFYRGGGEYMEAKAQAVFFVHEDGRVEPSIVEAVVSTVPLLQEPQFVYVPWVDDRGELQWAGATQGSDAFRMLVGRSLSGMVSDNPAQQFAGYMIATFIVDPGSGESLWQMLTSEGPGTRRKGKRLAEEISGRRLDLDENEFLRRAPAIRARTEEFESRMPEGAGKTGE